MSEPNTFGSRLAARMKEKGYSMPRLGKGLKAKKGGVLDGDIGRAAVFGWINGAGFPNAIQLAEICRRLDMSADYLLFGAKLSSPKVEAAKSAINQLSPEELAELQSTLSVHAAPRENTKTPVKTQLDTVETNSKDLQEWISREKDGTSGYSDSDAEPEQPRERSKGDKAA